MERELATDADDWIDDLPDVGIDEVAPAADLTPIEPPVEPGGGGGGGGGSDHRAADPETGSWFGLSMIVYVAFVGLTLVAVMAGAQGGEALAYAISAGLAVLYVGFLLVGGTWFHGWRHG